MICLRPPLTDGAGRPVAVCQAARESLVSTRELLSGRSVQESTKLLPERCPVMSRSERGSAGSVPAWLSARLLMPSPSSSAEGTRGVPPLHSSQPSERPSLFRSSILPVKLNPVGMLMADSGSNPRWSSTPSDAPSSSLSASRGFVPARNSRTFVNPSASGSSRASAAFVVLNRFVVSQLSGIPSLSVSSGLSGAAEMSVRTPVSCDQSIRPATPPEFFHTEVPVSSDGSAATAAGSVKLASVTLFARSRMRNWRVQRFCPASGWVAENSRRSGHDSSAGP